MKIHLLNIIDRQRPVYEVDFSARTYRLLRWEASGADRLPDIRGKLRKPGDFMNPSIFKQVQA